MSTDVTNIVTGGRGPFSSFRNVGFDWNYSTPKREIRDGATVFSGQVWLYGQFALDQFFTFFRPVNVRVAGDPSAGGTVYVDHWGADPSGALITHVLDLDGSGHITPQPKTYTAILSGITRSAALPGGLHQAEVEFTLVDAGTSLGGVPVTSGAGVAATQFIMSSTAADADVLNEWNGTSNNTPPSGWMNTGFDDSGWANGVEANLGGGDVPVSGSQAIWSSDTPEAVGQAVLFRQTFSLTVPTGHTLTSAFLLLQMSDRIDSAWLNGHEIAADVAGYHADPPASVAIDTTFFLAGTNLLAVESENLLSGAAWISYVIGVQIT
jgi:hypothetical protein